MTDKARDQEATERGDQAEEMYRYHLAQSDRQKVKRTPFQTPRKLSRLAPIGEEMGKRQKHNLHKEEIVTVVYPLANTVSLFRSLHRCCCADRAGKRLKSLRGRRVFFPVCVFSLKPSALSPFLAPLNTSSARRG